MNTIDVAHSENSTGEIVLYGHLQHHNDTLIKQTQGQRRKKKGRRNEGRRKTSL